jgi:hypothetical protein
MAAQYYNYAAYCWTSSALLRMFVRTEYAT